MIDHEKLFQVLETFPKYSQEVSEPATPRGGSKVAESKQLKATPGIALSPNKYKLGRAPGLQDAHITAHTFLTALLDEIINNPKTNPEQKFEELAKLYQRADIKISSGINYKISYLSKDIELPSTLLTEYGPLVSNEITRKAENLLVDISRDFINQFHKHGNSKIKIEIGNKRGDDNGSKESEASKVFESINVAITQDDILSLHLANVFDANNDGKCGGKEIRALGPDGKSNFLKDKISFHLYLIKIFLKEKTGNDDLYNRIYKNVISNIIKEHVKSDLYSDVCPQKLGDELIKETKPEQVQSASGSEARVKSQIKKDDKSNRIVIPSLPKRVADFINNTGNANKTQQKVEQIINNLKKIGLIGEEDKDRIKVDIKRIIEENDIMEGKIVEDKRLDNELRRKLRQCCKNNKSDSISELIAMTLLEKTTIDKETIGKEKNDFKEFISSHQRVYTEEEIMKLVNDVFLRGGKGRYQDKQITNTFIPALQRHTKNKLSRENASIVEILCNIYCDQENKRPASFFTKPPEPEQSHMVPTYPHPQTVGAPNATFQPFQPGQPLPWGYTMMPAAHWLTQSIQPGQPLPWGYTMVPPQPCVMNPEATFLINPFPIQAYQ